MGKVIKFTRHDEVGNAQRVALQSKSCGICEKSLGMDEPVGLTMAWGYAHDRCVATKFQTQAVPSTKKQTPMPDTEPDFFR